MSARVRMYLTAVCPFCIRAERLLMARGVSEIDKLRVDLVPGLRDEMIRRTGRHTVPQIYVDGTHVGGFEELSALDREGKLEPMLKA